MFNLLHHWVVENSAYTIYPADPSERHDACQHQLVLSHKLCPSSSPNAGKHKKTWGIGLNIGPVRCNLLNYTLDGYTWVIDHFGLDSLVPYTPFLPRCNTALAHPKGRTSGPLVGCPRHRWQGGSPGSPLSRPRRLDGGDELLYTSGSPIHDSTSGAWGSLHFHWGPSFDKTLGPYWPLERGESKKSPLELANVSRF